MIVPLQLVLLNRQVYTPKVIGTPTEYLEDTGGVDWTTKTLNVHTCTTGNLLVLGATRSNTGATGTFGTATFAGATLNEIGKVSSTNNGLPRIAAWWLRGASQAVNPNFVINSGANTRDAIFYFINIDRFATGIPVRNFASNTYASTAKNSHALTVTSQNSKSLLFNFTYSGNDDAMPMTSSWTLIDSGKTGNNTIADFSCVLSKKIAGGRGSITHTAGASTTVANWAALSFELKPFGVY